MCSLRLRFLSVIIYVCDGGILCKRLFGFYFIYLFIYSFMCVMGVSDVTHVERAFFIFICLFACLFACLFVEQVDQSSSCLCQGNYVGTSEWFVS